MSTGKEVNNELISQRFVEMRNLLNLNQNKFAEIVKVNRAYLSDIERGRVKPSFNVINNVLNSFSEVNGNWLITGRGQPLVRNQQSISFLATTDYTMISRFELSASAGGGAVIDHEQQSGEMAFRTDWLKSKNISPDHASVISVEGDSMKPTIEEGDSLLVNTSPTIQGHIQEGIYVISLDDLLMVKRLQRPRRETINILSDNPSYPPITITNPEAEKFRLIGRVIWHGRNI